MGTVSHMQFKNVEARRFQPVQQRPGQVRIDNNLSVTQIQATTDDQATIEFTYTASFGPMGVIKIDGSFQYQDPSVPDTVAQWTEKRQMPNAVAGQLHTTIMQACLPEAVLLAKAIHLPPPIPMPQIQVKKSTTATASTDADPSIS